jgi:sugar/nucleoside kinase (ribokinase family)
MFDVCVVGPVTRDVIRIKGSTGKELPGGVVQYAGWAYRKLGLSTAVITKAARQDAPGLLQGLRSIGVEIHCRDSDATTTFENIYADERQDSREQIVTSVAAPFTRRDLTDVVAKVFHLGPVIRGDMDPAFLEAVSRRGGRVALDGQGFLRTVVHGRVEAADWDEKSVGLAHVDVLKVDRHEAQLLSGSEDPEEGAYRIAKLGPCEVVITLGGGGSVILAREILYRIPAFPAQPGVDATGCGDSYFAGYLFHRLGSDDIEAAGRFAAALAALKLQRHGPFHGTEHDIHEILDERSHHGNARRE